MYIAKVVGKVVSVIKHAAYENRTLLLVQPLSLKSRLVRTPTIAVDYVGAGEGDVVLVGAGPGTAEEVFGVQNAPIRELVMGLLIGLICQSMLKQTRLTRMRIACFQLATLASRCPIY